jgi:hypothetical protein
MSDVTVEAIPAFGQIISVLLRYVQLGKNELGIRDQFQIDTDEFHVLSSYILTLIAELF